MGIEIEKILVLKAFHMGRVISDKKTYVSKSLEMINLAIKKFNNMADAESQLRLLFYVLLKSEILRDTESIVELRKYSKALASDLNSNIFDYYMLIEQASLSSSKVDGFQSGMINNVGFRTSINCSSNYDSNSLYSYDVACQAK